jgi:hypothetical protein
MSSPHARKRKFRSLFRLAVFTLFAGGLAGGVFYGFLHAGEALRQVELPRPSSPIVEVRFASSGVLDTTWFSHTFANTLPEDLLAVDIYGLKERLERHGQIARATVRRELPGTLEIVVEERVPVVRLRTRDARGKEIVLLVASDGSVFLGEGYTGEAIRNLPYLAGVRLRKAEHENGFAPIPQMPQVAELVQLTRTHMAGHFRSWKWIDCTYFAGDPESPGARILVQTSHFGELVFSPRDFPRQLERLARVLNATHRRVKQPIRSVDLAFEKQAVVTLR